MPTLRFSQALLLLLALIAILLLGFGTAQHLAQARVTATATSAAPLPTTVVKTATPRPSPTVVRPTSTLPAAHSVRTGGITYDMASLRALQSLADRGGAEYSLDPVRVTVHDLPQFGFSPGPIDVVSPAPPDPSPTAHHGEDGLLETDVIVRYEGKQYWIVLNQFVRSGPGGIWSVITITPM